MYTLKHRHVGTKSSMLVNFHKDEEDATMGILINVMSPTGLKS